MCCKVAILVGFNVSVDNKASEHAADFASALKGKLTTQYDAAATKLQDMDARFTSRVNDFRDKTDNVKASALDAVATRVSLLSTKMAKVADDIVAIKTKVSSDVKAGVELIKAGATSWFNKIKNVFTEKSDELKTRYEEVKGATIEVATQAKEVATQAKDNVVAASKTAGIIAGATALTVDDLLIKPAAEKISLMAKAFSGRFQVNKEALLNPDVKDRPTAP